MALEGTDAVVDVPPLDSEQDNAELGPVTVTTVRAADGDADEADAQGQGLILNDLQAFYADNEKVGADIDPQLSSIIENLTKARLPDDKLKAKLDGYMRPRNTPTLIDTRVNLEIWNKLSPPTRSRDIKLQRIQHSLVQATVAVATGTDALVKALRSGESLACSNMALPMTALVDGLALMINANHDINQQRRDDKKGDLNLAYATLAACCDIVIFVHCMMSMYCFRGLPRLHLPSMYHSTTVLSFSNVAAMIICKGVQSTIDYVCERVKVTRVFLLHVIFVS